MGTARRLPCPHHANTPRVQVGKTTLIKALIKHWVRQDVRDVRGPVTLVTGKSRRLTLLECPQELGPMMDAAKVSACVKWGDRWPRRSLQCGRLQCGRRRNAAVALPAPATGPLPPA